VKRLVELPVFEPAGVGEDGAESAAVACASKALRKEASFLALKR